MLRIANQAHYHKTSARLLVERVRGLKFDQEFLLRIDDDRISLCTEIDRQQTCYNHGFSEPALLRRAAQRNQALLKACNNRRRDLHRVGDLTAGWGRDAFILASHGQSVIMIEQHPLIFACLQYLVDIIAADNPETPAKRMRPVFGNSLQYLADLGGEPPDCLYLDPMFPTHKSGARPGKELQLLQLLTVNLDMAELFTRALQVARNRVVVKRPLHAPRISEHRPDIVYREKTIRFDVYLR